MHLYTEETNLIKESAGTRANTPVTILGVPFDSTETTLSGQRKAPDSIRNAFLNIETGDVFDKLTDAGNLMVVHGSASKTLSRLEQTIDDLFSGNKEVIPVLLGGEHTVTLGAVKSMIKRHGEFDILCFDAHYDLKNNWQTEKLNHSTVMRRIYELNKNIGFIGVREYSCEEKDFFKKNGIGRNLDKIKRSGKPLYVSVDVDVFDTSVMPGVSDSVPGGIRVKEFFDVMKLFKKRKIIGMDIVEFNPLVEEYSTARNIAYALRELVNLL